jgi:ABC-type multidrug transport system permease subunit
MPATPSLPADRARASVGRTFWANARFAPRTTLWFMRVDYLLGEIFVVPFTQMLFFAFVAGLSGGGASVPYVVIGNAVSVVTYSAVFSVCQTTDSEKQMGTMEHLLVSPTSRAALYLGRALVPILTSLAVVGMAFVYAVYVFHVSIGAAAVPPLAISIVLTAVAMVGFGLFLGGVALYLRTSIILGNIFLFIGLLLSGVNFPVSPLPLPLRVIGYGFPLTWGVAAVRAAVAGAAPSVVLLDWGLLGLSAALSYGLALGLWKTFERRALSTGSLARF